LVFSLKTYCTLISLIPVFLFLTFGFELDIPCCVPNLLHFTSSFYKWVVKGSPKTSVLKISNATFSGEVSLSESLLGLKECAKSGAKTKIILQLYKGEATIPAGSCFIYCHKCFCLSAFQFRRISVWKSLVHSEMYYRLPRLSMCVCCHSLGHVYTCLIT
jgi:hypothetical protein